MRRTLAIIGCGNMGGAIAEGIIKSGYMAPENMILMRRNTTALSHFAELGCVVTDDMKQACSEADAVMLCVKPQMISAVMADIADIRGDKLFISIAVGTTVETIQNALPGCPVVRVMPNTPLMVGRGVSAICTSSDCSDEDKAFAAGLFECAGSVVFIDEEQMNPVAGVTSSSIAFFARFIGAMAQWAKENGFEYMDDAELLSLVCDAASGTAKLLKDKGMTCEELVRAVASPKGTTEAGLRSFDETDLEGSVKKALTASNERAKEIARMK